METPREPEPQAAVAETPRKSGISRALANSRTLKPFFSSTFSDFTEEREHLTKHVFPQFIKMCEQKACMFSPIDLRWGITAEQSGDGQVINICLNAVERSRPFFITCLGERYGWSRGPEKGQDGHDELYQRTLDNAKEHFPWIADYEDRAVTELEIMQAFLYNTEHNLPIDTTYMHVYLRQPKDEHPRDFDEHSSHKLAALKERLKKSPVRCIEYDNVEELGEYIMDDLTRMLNGVVATQQEILQEGSTGWYKVDTERQSHDFFGAKIGQFFVAGDAYISTFADHFGYEAGERQFKLGTPLLISGPTGAGKSATCAALANWARERLEAAAEGKPVCVLVHHVGCTVQSRSRRAFTRRALTALKMTFNIKKQIPNEDDQLDKCFGEFMEIAGERGYTLIILDGVENLNNEGNTQEMAWLPDPPEENDQWSAKMSVVSTFQLVVTATTGTDQHNALLRRKWRAVQLQDFDADAKKDLCRQFMGNRAKTLTTKQLDTIAEAPQTAGPLFLRAVLEELVVFGKFEELDNRIDELLRCPQVVDVYTYKIDRVQQQISDGDVIKQVLSLMWVSRSGLTADELMALVGGSLGKEEFEHVHSALDGFLINRTGLLDFIDPMLRMAVQKVFLEHRFEVKQFRKRLARYLQDRYQPGEERYSEVAWQYRQANEDAELMNTITHPEAFPLFRSDRHKEDFMMYCRHVGRTGKSDYSQVLEKLTERLGLDTLVQQASEITEVDQRIENMASIAFEVATFAVEVEQFSAAEELLIACMQIDQKVMGSLSTKLARDMVLLGRLYVRNRHPPADGQKGFIKGRELLSQAQTILTSDEMSTGSADVGEESDLGLTFHYTGLLDMFEYFGSKDIAKLDSAIANCESAMRVWEEKDDTYNKAETLNLLGSLNQQKGVAGVGDHKLLIKAEELLKEGLKVRESTLSRSDPALAQSLNSLGDYYTKQGNLPDAESYYNRARRVYVEGLGPKHTRGVFPLIGLVAVEELRPNAEKDFDLMVRYMEQVVAIREQLGPQSPPYQQSLDKLRKLKQQQFIQNSASKRIARLWKELRDRGLSDKGAPEGGRAKIAEGEPPTPSAAAGGGGGGGGSSSAAAAAGGATDGQPQQVGGGSMPGGDLREPPAGAAQYPQQQQQSMQHMPWPPQQQPPQWPGAPPYQYSYPPPAPAAPAYPPPGAAAAAPLPSGALEYMTSMATRVDTLEGRLDSANEKMMEMMERHHRELATAREAETARLKQQLEEERQAAERLRIENGELREANAQLGALLNR